MRVLMTVEMSEQAYADLFIAACEAEGVTIESAGHREYVDLITVKRLP